MNLENKLLRRNTSVRPRTSMLPRETHGITHRADRRSIQSYMYWLMA